MRQSTDPNNPNISVTTALSDRQFVQESFRSCSATTTLPYQFKAAVSAYHWNCPSIPSANNVGFIEVVNSGNVVLGSATFTPVGWCCPTTFSGTAAQQTGVITLSAPLNTNDVYYFRVGINSTYADTCGPTAEPDYVLYVGLNQTRHKPPHPEFTLHI
jgi:hypothetical protein